MAEELAKDMAMAAQGWEGTMGRGAEAGCGVGDQA